MKDYSRGQMIIIEGDPRKEVTSLTTAGS